MTDRAADTAWDRVGAAAEVVAVRVPAAPELGIVLGSGLAAFADRIEDAVSLDYGAIPHWPRPTVAGHPGRLVAGRIAGCRIVALAGRVHAYEGRAPEEVAFGIRVLHRLGAGSVILTNAAGGIHPELGPGDFMLIADHLNLTGTNPLVGPNDPRFGPRFPDMTEIYSARLRRLAAEAATAAGVRFLEGVYAGVSGPSYETPAEIRAFGALGADAVGMSTVHEAIVARHLGLEVLGISCIANAAAGRLPRVLSETEVLAETARARAAFGRLLEGTLARLRPAR